MSKTLDMTGKRYGNLVVVSFIGMSTKHNSVWLCKCDCGKTKEVTNQCLTSGHTKSCGCLNGRKKIDLTGRKFGKWTVIEFAEIRKNRTFWKCICECGTERLVSREHLLDGHSSSCGCSKSNAISVSQLLPDGETGFRSLYNAYKRNANIRGKSFLLTKDEFRDLTKKNCFYCGSSPSSIFKTRSNNGSYVYNGIDRIDSSIGYEINNVITCCGTCNYAKRSMSQQEYINWIQKAYMFIKGKGLV